MPCLPPPRAHRAHWTDEARSRVLRSSPPSQEDLRRLPARPIECAGRRGEREQLRRDSEARVSGDQEPHELPSGSRGESLAWVEHRKYVFGMEVDSPACKAYVSW